MTGQHTSLFRGDARAGHTVNSNANISLLEGRGVVDSITSHADHVMGLLQHLHNHELVLREHLSKAISPLDKVLSILESIWHTLALLGLHVYSTSQHGNTKLRKNLRSV